jgi:hypothetical protein
MSEFDRDYFERGPQTGKSLYRDYRWMPEQTIPYCHHLTVELGIKYGQTLLDFGCAKGFYVQALRLLGYETWGCDISEYATSHCHPDAAQYIFCTNGFRVPVAGGSSLWDWIHAKDVLEHVKHEDIGHIIENFKITAKRVFAIVPLGKDGEWVIPEHAKDVTHRICEPLSWWMDLFQSHGWAVLGTCNIPKLKNHWHRRYPYGHGYITAWNEDVLREECR